eukprot:CAMPEP_0119433904 /NCGR_PEP_ID=MMETSP1335-20130426/50399_1 /TAXON_ID=259385 /ORGANISM="Chrysoculter rhomboideus, Strain RCC1486" /LENGTH=265 /DNA_ID=CAMNT_0007459753 /DNA_START=112 /DNA_END=910 /DNA_ORIENTATION=+
MTRAAMLVLAVTAGCASAEDYEMRFYRTKDCSGEPVVNYVSWPTGEGYECVAGKYNEYWWLEKKDESKARIHMGCVKESGRIMNKKGSNLMYVDVWNSDGVGSQCEADTWTISNPRMFNSDMNKKGSNLMYVDVWNSDGVGSQCEADTWTLSNPCMFNSEELAQKFIRGECIGRDFAYSDYAVTSSFKLNKALEKGDYPDCSVVQMSLGIVGGGAGVLGVCLGVLVAYFLWKRRGAQSTDVIKPESTGSTDANPHPFLESTDANP